MISVLSTLPFYYLFKSRLKSHYEQFSWCLIYVVPVFFLIVISSEIPVYQLVLLYVLSLAALFSIYETGYLENDLVTILDEQKPTFRLSEQERHGLSNNYFLISFLKTILALALIAFIVYFEHLAMLELYIDQFIICLVFMRFVFFLHNYFRGKVNIITFMLLSFFKYASPLLLFFPVDESAVLIVVSFFMFPLIRALEHATRERYALTTLYKLIGNHDLFRLKYYFICLLVLVPAIVYWELPYFIFIVFLYYFLARLSGYFLVRYKSSEIEAFRSRQRDNPY